MIARVEQFKVQRQGDLEESGQQVLFFMPEESKKFQNQNLEGFLTHKFCIPNTLNYSLKKLTCQRVFKIKKNSYY